MTERVFINKDTAVFKCPNCNRTSAKDVSAYKKIKTSVKIKCKCPCGHTYSVILERRQHFRKKVDLPGSYTAGNSKGLITVKDLSRSGLQFRIETMARLDKGQTVTVEFTLDDRERSKIKRKVRIMNIHDRFVGAEFTSSEHFDRLGPYLLYSIN